MTKYKVKSRVSGGGFFGLGTNDLSGIDFVEANSEEEATSRVYRDIRMALVAEDEEDNYTISILDVEESKWMHYQKY